jgi:PKD repeat protein
MKKFYSVVLGLNILVTSQAQILTNQVIKKHVIHTNVRSAGDTLAYMPFIDVYINSTDSAGFVVNVEDFDFLAPFNPGWPMDFWLYYYDGTTSGSPTPGMNSFYHPWENPLTDSSFFWGATSRFTPPGTADNWLMFGPLTIPSSGATLIWYDKTQMNKDGYEIRVTTSTVPGMYQSQSDFSDPAIYSESDDPMPSATYSQDTLWEYKSVVIPASYNGQLVSIAFRHTATDMDMLFLDEFTLIEGGTVCDANFTMVQDTSNLYNFTVYNNSSTGSTYSYLWDFGDSTTSTLQYPTHTYSGSGPYQLCLTVTDTSGCSDTQCDSLSAGHSSTGINVVVVAPLPTVISEMASSNSLNVYPNPFSSLTTVNYSITKNEIVEISVFNLLGDAVSTIEKGSKQAGNHQVSWNAESLAKGMYMLQLKTAEQVSVKKIIITK